MQRTHTPIKMPAMMLSVVSQNIGREQRAKRKVMGLSTNQPNLLIASADTVSGSFFVRNTNRAHADVRNAIPDKIAIRGNFMIKPNARTQTRGAEKRNSVIAELQTQSP